MRRPSHSPPGPRKVASPDSAEIPAPVRITILRMPSISAIKHRIMGRGKSMTRIGLIGAGGRMGRTIASVLAATADAEIDGGVDRPGTNREIAPGVPIAAHAAVLRGQCDDLHDFSYHSACATNRKSALADGRPTPIVTPR